MMNGVEHTSLTWEDNDKLKEFQGKYVLPEEEYNQLDAERGEDDKAKTNNPYFTGEVLEFSLLHGRVEW